ncbi:MAG: hypothetical protein ILP19_03020 [Oscillospiraceae bacterium]|nr:hypothetical protein [Oscillospiraceae bacterium]
MYDIFSFGYIYDAILFMLFLSPLIDLVGIVKIMRSSVAERKEYAEEIVRWLKLVMYLFAGGYCFYIAIAGGYSAVTAAIHIVIGLLLYISMGLLLYIKIKYR